MASFCQRMCFFWAIFSASYFVAIWFFYLVLDPVFDTRLADSLDAGLPFTPEFGLPTTANLLRVIHRSGASQDVDEILQKVGLGSSWRAVQREHGYSSTRDDSPSFTHAHPSSIRDQASDPLDDVGVDSKLELPQMTEHELIQHYSPILKAAVGALRQRKYDLAKNLFVRCSLGSEKDSYCINRVGELTLVGLLFDKDFSTACELFVDAASEGNPDAQYNLGILLASIVENDPHYAILHRSIIRKQGILGRNRTDDGASSSSSRASTEALSILYLYAASTAGHPGALMALAHKHETGAGVPKLCSTAALNYIEVAKGITEIYSSGMPQAVELIRLNLDYKKVVIRNSILRFFFWKKKKLYNIFVEYNEYIIYS